MEKLFEYFPCLPNIPRIWVAFTNLALIRANCSELPDSISTNPSPQQNYAMIG